MQTSSTRHPPVVICGQKKTLAKGETYSLNNSLYRYDTAAFGRRDIMAFWNTPRYVVPKSFILMNNMHHLI